MSTSATDKSAQRVDISPPRIMGSLSHWLIVGICLLAVIVFFSTASEDWFTIVNYTLIAAIAALALNVLSGYTGQVSLGLAFFMAIGAYTAALLGGSPPTSPLDPQGWGLSVFIWLPAAGIVAALVGALIGPTALRLKGFYLGIVTLALVFIGQYLFKNLASITGGSQGRTFPAPVFGDYSFTQQNDLLGITLTSGQQYFRGEDGGIHLILISGRDSRCALCLLYTLRDADLLGFNALHPIRGGNYRRGHCQYLGLNTGGCFRLWAATGYRSLRTAAACRQWYGWANKR